MSGFGINPPGYGLDPYGDLVSSPPVHLYLTAVNVSLQASPFSLATFLMTALIPLGATLNSLLSDWETGFEVASPIPVASTLETLMEGLTVTLD